MPEMSRPSKTIEPAETSRQPEHHPADARLAAAALADERHDLPGPDVEGDVGDGRDALAAERAGLELLRHSLEAEHQAATFQHAAWRPGSNSTKGGCSAHFANASGQRSRKRQPCGGSRSDGGRPAMPVSRLSSNRAPASGSEPISMRVYGCRGSLTIALAGALLDELARVHDDDRVGDLVQDREVVGDHDRALDEPALPELDEHLGDGLLRRDVESGGQLVRDEERGVEERREHHHDALLHAAGELDREAVEDVVRTARRGRAAVSARAACPRRRRRANRGARRSAARSCASD